MQLFKEPAVRWGVYHAVVENLRKYVRIGVEIPAIESTIGNRLVFIHFVCPADQETFVRDLIRGWMMEIGANNNENYDSDDEDM